MNFRVPDWEAKMQAEIERHADLPGIWGKSDCFTFSLDVASVITGTKSFSANAKYTTEIGAAKAMVKNGFSSIGDMFASKFPEAPVFSFRRGDIGVTRIGGVERGCVVTGSGLAIKGQKGIEIVEVQYLSRLFLVGG
jgi:hypothetical protein